jgi:hypothetical protein
MQHLSGENIFRLPSFPIGVAASAPVCSGSPTGGASMRVVPGQNSLTAAGAKSMLATVLMAFVASRTMETYQCLADGVKKGLGAQQIA